MSDLPFDIDDILNEINKRKEEIEREINSVSINIEDTQNRIAEKAAEVKPVEAEEAEVIPKPEKAPVVDEPVVESIEESVEEPIQEAAPDNGEAHFNEHELSASYFEDVDRIFAEADNTAETDAAGSSAEGSVNIFDLMDDAPAAEEVAPVRSPRKSKKKWNKTKKGKILISVILFLVVALLGSGAYGVYYINDMLNNITIEEVERGEESKIEDWKGMDELIVKFDDIYENGNVSSYRDMIKDWYYNGDPVSSTNILNVLLIGEDTRGDEIKDEGTLADSVIIASVNIETGELILSSILRDTYAYYELVPGDESTGTYSKINEAMSRGNLTAYINAVERLFKVDINNYVIVNFANFKKIIDTLGGVDIDMTAAEIREINNDPGTYGDVYIDGDAGMKHLNGEQALAYCRIRHLDGDQFRADRQKTVLLDIFHKIKNASPLKLTSIVPSFLPYVKTGFTKSEILSIGQYALSNGWLGYNIVTHTVPQEDTRVGGSDSSFYNTWCWKVDFPLASQVLQETIYGRTNVILADNRPNYSRISAY